MFPPSAAFRHHSRCPSPVPGEHCSSDREAEPVGSVRLEAWDSEGPRLALDFFVLAKRRKANQLCS